MLRTSALALLSSVLLAAEPLAAYTGAAGDDRLAGAFALSDGTWLVCGAAADLAWLPAGIPTLELSGAAVAGLNSSASGATGFVLQLSADGATVLRCLQFPAGKVTNVQRLRSTGQPGAATGDLYLSGRLANASSDSSSGDGYFIARLSDNFVAAAPTGLTWAVNVPCRQVDGQHEQIQPWDVRSDGKVIYAQGQAYGADWLEVAVRGADGQPTTMEHWPVHWTAGGAESRYVAASAVPGGAARSAILFKTNRAGGLRSTTDVDLTRWGSDANGLPRRGAFPEDIFFSQNVLAGNTGPGYTGYRTGTNPTARIGQIVIDRRDNGLYLGWSDQSKLPDGLPDFEPAVAAFSADGALRWWDRLYQDFTDTNGNGVYDDGESRNSTPDQYVDALAIDASGDRLVVLGRCHGNNTNNLWRGNQIALSPGGSGFQNQFTGTNGNIHIQWLGSYDLGSGRIRAATYVADYKGWETNAGGTLTQAVIPSGPLAGWPSPNAGWADVTTTRCTTELLVDGQGRVWVAGASARPFTSTGAYQENVKPSVGEGQGGAFLRVYPRDLSTILYGTLVRAPWTAGAAYNSSGGATLAGWAVHGSAVMAVGWTATGATGIPSARVPAWARSTPVGGDEGLVLRLDLATLAGDANGDGVVNQADLSSVRDHFGRQSSAGDVTGDSRVDAQDLGEVTQALHQ